MTASRIPPRFARASLVDLEVGVRLRLEAWLDVPLAERGPVFVFGPTGVGKSHLAAALLAEHARRHVASALADVVENSFGEFKPRSPWEIKRAGLWLSSLEFLDRVRRENRAKRPPAESTLEAATRARVLVIDDLGTEALSTRDAWGRARVLHLVSARWDACAPTIFTSNLAPEALGLIDMRLASRACSGLVLGLEGQDRRLPRLAKQLPLLDAGIQP